MVLQQDYDPKGNNERWHNFYRKIVKTSRDVDAAVGEVERAIDREARCLAEMTALFDASKERWIRSGAGGRSCYKCNTKRNVIILTELSLPGMSITNGAEGVVHDLVECGVLDPTNPRRIVYRDQQGQWDGLAVRDGHFAGFVRLGARSEEDAIQAAIHSDWNANPR